MLLMVYDAVSAVGASDGCWCFCCYGVLLGVLLLQLRLFCCFALTLSFPSHSFVYLVSASSYTSPPPPVHPQPILLSLHAMDSQDDAPKMDRRVKGRSSPSQKEQVVIPDDDSPAPASTAHPLGIQTDNNAWSGYTPGLAPALPLFGQEASSSTGNSKGSRKGDKGNKEDPFFQDDPWNNEETKGKGSKGDGKALAPDRTLEVDPVFLLFLRKAFDVSVIFVNEEITEWSNTLMNLPPSDDPEYYVGSPTQVKAWQNSMRFPEARERFIERAVHSNGRKEVWLVRTPPYRQSAFANFTRQIMTLWTLDQLTNFEIVAITLLQELPGNHKLWQQMSPDPFVDSILEAYIVSSQLFDSSVISRLHGAPHSRGWDIRSGKVWITKLTHRQRSGTARGGLLSMGRVEDERIRVERTSDYFYMDSENANEDAAQTFHAALRNHIIELLNLDPSDLTSTKRLSAAKTRAAVRFLHIFTLPAGVAKDKLLNITGTSLKAFHSDLCELPLLLIRANNTASALRALEHVPHKACCFATPNIIAMAPTGNLEEAVQLLKEKAAEIAGLISVKNAATGDSLYVPAASGSGRNDFLADTSRIVGAPQHWGQREFSAIFKGLHNSGLFIGQYNIERSSRTDGSVVGACRLICQPASSIANLLALSSLTVDTHNDGAVTLSFQGVTDRFQWGTGDNRGGESQWVKIAGGDLNATSSTRRREEEGTADLPFP
jgi:hypothetical protein